MQEAEERYAQLTDDVRSIQSQLTQRKPIGRVPDAEFRDYMMWRRAAVTASTAKSREASFVKSWIKERRRLVSAPAVVAGRTEETAYDPNDARSLLTAVYACLGRIFSDLEPEDVSLYEQQLRDDIQSYLVHKG